MIEFGNVREALADAIKTVEAKEIKIIDGDEEVDATVEDVQELLRERLYNIADILGMSDLYVK